MLGAGRSGDGGGGEKLLRSEGGGIRYVDDDGRGIKSKYDTYQT